LIHYRIEVWGRREGVAIQQAGPATTELGMAWKLLASVVNSWRPSGLMR
jgi:hypothetical protein